MLLNKEAARKILVKGEKMDNKEREQARLRKQKQRDKERDISGSVTPPNVTVDVIHLTELGLTIGSMMPSERELWDKHGFDCRTLVYNECLRRQKQRI